MPASNLYGSSRQLADWQLHARDHVAAGDERIHPLEHLAAAVQHADPGRTERLVAGPGVEVGADRRHVHRHVRDRLGSVDQGQRARSMRARHHLGDRIDRAEHVRDVGERHQPHVATSQLGVQLLERQLAPLVDLEVAQRRAALAAEDLPGHQIGVMLHLGDQHGIARAHVRAPPRVGDEVDRLGRVLGEDRALRVGAHERGDGLARAVVGGVRLLGEGIHAAVHVRVVLAQVRRERLDHDRGLLRGRGTVEVHQLVTVKTPREDREVAAHLERGSASVRWGSAGARRRSAGVCRRTS